MVNSFKNGDFEFSKFKDDFLLKSTKIFFLTIQTTVAKLSGRIFIKHRRVLLAQVV